MGAPARDDTVRFALADPGGRLTAVRLQQQVGLAEPLDFVRTGIVWVLDRPRPDVARMEYEFELAYRNGSRSTILDPANPDRAGGAFGDKSVLAFPDYVPPAWLDVQPVAAQVQPYPVSAPGLDAQIDITLWAPTSLAHGEPAPLLLVHDGPEYARLGGFTAYLGAAIATGALPPVRAALLGPGDRNAWYSANPAYADALCGVVVPALDTAVPATVRVGVGVSLGGLAMLHAHRCHPGTFGGLLLQSSSFFTPQLDSQESAFSGFAEVTGFVAGIGTATDDPAPIPVTLTCGTVEENLANNVAMTDTLCRLGYTARLDRVRDAHNYTAWRDALDPHLGDLVTAVAGVHAP